MQCTRILFESTNVPADTVDAQLKMRIALEEIMKLLQNQLFVSHEMQVSDMMSQWLTEMGTQAVALKRLSKGFKCPVMKSQSQWALCSRILSLLQSYSYAAWKSKDVALYGLIVNPSAVERLTVVFELLVQQLKLVSTNAFSGEDVSNALTLMEDIEQVRHFFCFIVSCVTLTTMMS